MGWLVGLVCAVLLLVVALLVWIATIHQHIVDPHNDLEEEADKRYPLTKFFYWTSKSVISSIIVRVLLYLAVCVALYTCAVINVVSARRRVPFLHHYHLPRPLLLSFAPFTSLPT